VDQDGQYVRAVTFPSYGFTLTQNRWQTVGGSFVQQFDFAASLASSGSVGLNYSLFSNTTYLPYGNISLLNRPATNKWSFLMSGWHFASTSHRLELRVALSVGRSQNIVSISQGTEIAQQRTTRYTVTATHTTCTVELADFALVDEEATQVFHRFEYHTLVLDLPAFNRSFTYDPSFGLFLNNRVPGGTCGSEVSLYWILALVAIGVTLPCAATIGGIVYVRNRRARAARHKLLQARLKALQDTERGPTDPRTSTVPATS
jgi:hypothetical protein